jgi:hypothetical protein
VGQQVTPVTTGWVVKKRFTKKEKDAEGNPLPKTFEKVVSKRFSSIEAADIFKRTAEKYAPPVAGEHDVTFYVTAQEGTDNLPPSF